MVWSKMKHVYLEVTCIYAYRAEEAKFGGNSQKLNIEELYSLPYFFPHVNESNKSLSRACIMVARQLIYKLKYVLNTNIIG